MKNCGRTKINVCRAIMIICIAVFVFACCSCTRTEDEGRKVDIFIYDDDGFIFEKFIGVEAADVCTDREDCIKFTDKNGTKYEIYYSTFNVMISEGGQGQ